MRTLLQIFLVVNCLCVLANAWFVIVDPPHYANAAVGCLNICAAILLGYTLKGVPCERS